MAKYINKFDTLEEYKAAVTNLDYPSINYIAEYDELKWDEELPPYKVLITNLDGSTALYVPFDENDTVIHQNEIVGIYNRGSYGKFLIGEGVTAADDNIFNFPNNAYTPYQLNFQEMYVPSTFDQAIECGGFRHSFGQFARNNQVSGIYVDDIKIADGANLSSLFPTTRITSLDLSDFDADGKNMNAFAWKARNLQSITLPNNLTEISCESFQMTSLTSITIPSGVTSIGSWAFQDSSLTSITIPSGVTSIGRNAFSECRSLQKITFLSVTPPTFDYGIFDNTNNCPIYVPCEGIVAYKTALPDLISRIQAIPTNPSADTQGLEVGSMSGGISYPFYAIMPYDDGMDGAATCVINANSLNFNINYADGTFDITDGYQSYFSIEDVGACNFVNEAEEEMISHFLLITPSRFINSANDIYCTRFVGRNNVTFSSETCVTSGTWVTYQAETVLNGNFGGIRISENTEIPEGGELVFTTSSGSYQIARICESSECIEYCCDEYDEETGECIQYSEDCCQEDCMVYETYVTEYDSQGDVVDQYPISFEDGYWTYDQSVSINQTLSFDVDVYVE